MVSFTLNTEFNNNNLLLKQIYSFAINIELYTICRLTAWALRVFKDASFPEWEFHLWIDPYIFLSMIRWLLTRQKSDGNFIETSNYKNPFDGRISQNVIFIFRKIIIFL